MARSRRIRRYKRKGVKWAPNIQEIDSTTLTFQPNTSTFFDFTLAFNPTQVNTATSQVYTVKRIEATFNIEAEQSLTSIDSVTAYIMFKPQGMTITRNYNLEHPEYIMAYKFLGGPTASTAQPYQPIRVVTRLSRKLQSGDSVILFIKGVNPSMNAIQTVNFSGLVRWWTKAN